MAAADAMEALASMQSMVELISDSLRQPCAGDDQRNMVEDLIRECADQRTKLEELALVVIEQDGGEKTFNEITLVLDRLERLREQKEVWARAPPPPRAPLAGTPAASPSGGGGFAPPMGSFGSGSGPTGGQLGEEGVPQLSPQLSHAPSSEAAFDSLPRFNSSSEMKKERKKKEKKEKKAKGDQADDFGFPPTSTAGPEGFGAWPPSSAQEPEAAGSSAWGVGAGEAGWPGAGGSAHSSGGFGGVAGAEGAAGEGSFGAWGSAPACTDSGAAGFDGFPDVAMPSGWGADAPQEQAGSASAAPLAASSFGAFGEDPPPASSYGVPPEQFNAAPDQAWLAEVPPGALAAAPAKPPTATVESWSQSGAPQRATMHIRRPFAEVERDRNAFESIFIKEVAQATGVAPHRIRIRAIRAGS